MAESEKYAEGAKPRKADKIDELIDTATNVAAGAAAAIGVGGAIAGAKKLLQRDDRKTRRTRQQQKRLDRNREKAERRISRAKEKGEKRMARAYEKADKQMERIREKANKANQRIAKYGRGGGGPGGEVYDIRIGPDVVKPKLKRPGS
jgi:uncharacterized protein HemX